MRNHNELTALRVARLTKPGRYGDGDGLYLRVAEYFRAGGKATRSKNWVFRYEHGGRERWMGLGPLDTVSLAGARAHARECRQLLLRGADPIEARRAIRRGERLEAARATTFKQCAELYLKAHLPSWKNAKHRAQWPSTLGTYVFPVIGNVAVADVDTALTLKCLEPIWHGKPRTANRVRGRIESILDWAKARDLRSGDNPARWKGHLKNLLPAHHKVRGQIHLAALPYAEAPAFLAELRARNEIAACALEFTILTAARTGEVLHATWDEIDLRKKLWTVPRERMKAGVQHTVPLSGRAMEILTAIPRVAGCPFLFPGIKVDRPMAHNAMSRLLRTMRPTATVHGFRSTFRDWCGDRTNFPREVVESVLAHAIENQAEAAYRRGSALQKRQRLMADWASFLAKVPAKAPAAEDNVVAIAGR
jgi:integrase